MQVEDIFQEFRTVRENLRKVYPDSMMTLRRPRANQRQKNFRSVLTTANEKKGKEKEKEMSSSSSGSPSELSSIVSRSSAASLGTRRPFSDKSNQLFVPKKESRQLKKTFSQ